MLKAGYNNPAFFSGAYPTTGHVKISAISSRFWDVKKPMIRVWNIRSLSLHVRVSLLERYLWFSLSPEVNMQNQDVWCGEGFESHHSLQNISDILFLFSETNQTKTIYKRRLGRERSCGNRRYPHSVLNPVPPFGHVKIIASSVHTYQHDPHSMHKSRLFILAFPSAIS